MLDNNGAGPDILGSVALLVVFVAAHLGFLLVVHILFGIFGAEHLISIHQQSTGQAFFPSFLHLRVLVLSVAIGSIMAGVAYFDKDNPKLAPYLAAIVPFAVLVADGRQFLDNTFFVVLMVQMAATQFALTAWWTKGLADKWQLVPHLRHY